jgi:hypothetical protein
MGDSMRNKFKVGDVIETIRDGSECYCSYEIGTRAIVTNIYSHDDEFVDVRWIRKTDDGQDVMDRRGNPLGQMDGGYQTRKFRLVKREIRGVITPHKFL